MLQKIKRLNLIGYIFLTIQLLSYLGSFGNNQPVTTRSTAENIGYYVGFNFLIMLAIIFFIWARSIRKKLNASTQKEMIDSIGNN